MSAKWCTTEVFCRFTPKATCGWCAVWFTSADRLTSCDRCTSDKVNQHSGYSRGVVLNCMLFCPTWRGKEWSSSLRTAIVGYILFPVEIILMWQTDNLAGFDEKNNCKTTNTKNQFDGFFDGFQCTTLWRNEELMKKQENLW